VTYLSVLARRRQRLASPEVDQTRPYRVLFVQEQAAENAIAKRLRRDRVIAAEPTECHDWRYLTTSSRWNVLDRFRCRSVHYDSVMLHETTNSSSSSGNREAAHEMSNEIPRDANDRQACEGPTDNKSYDDE